MKRTTALLLASTFTLAATPAVAQTIRIQGYGGQDPAIVQRLLTEVIGADLEAEGITVQYEPIETDYNAVLTNNLSAGTAGDVFYMPDAVAPGFIATGKALPLNDLVDTEPFIDSLLEVYTQDGQIYGIPKDFNTLAVFYNTDLFDDAEVEYPNADDTFTTFTEKLQAVSELDDEIAGACLGADYARLGAFAYANGWQPFNEDGTVTLGDEAFTSAFDFYTGLVTSGVAVQPSDVGAGWPGDCLAQEKAAVAIEGAWILGFLRDNAPNLSYAAAPLPKSDTTGERGNFTYSVAWAINADSPNQEAAVKVLEALTSEAAQQFILEQGLALPSREALSDNAYFAEDTPEAQASLTIFDGASDGNVLGFQFANIGTDYMTPINNAITAVMTGQAETAGALEGAQSEIDAVIARAAQ